MICLSDISNLSNDSYALVKMQCSNKKDNKNKCNLIDLIYYNQAIEYIKKNNYTCKVCQNYNKHINVINKTNPLENLNNINSRESAYILGWIFGNGYLDLDNDELIIKTIKNNVQRIIKILKKISNNVYFNNNHLNQYKITISSKNFSNYIKTFLNLSNDYYINKDGNNNSKLINISKVLLNLNNTIINKKYFIDIIRGYFESLGNIINKEEPECNFYIYSSDFLQFLIKFIDIPFTIHNDKITFNNSNCIDFLGLIYNNINNEDINLMCKKKFIQYNNCINWKFNLNNNLSTKLIDKCRVLKVDKNAIIPYKSKLSDVGFDLTIIKVYKKLNSVTSLYDTGLKINVDFGYYTEIVPRSSLSKSGYMLSNSIGIIEQSYNGNLLVALTKVDPNADKIQFPFRCCQLIFKPQIYINMIEVCENFEKTSRDEGGFGSTK